MKRTKGDSLYGDIVPADNPIFLNLILGIHRIHFDLEPVPIH